MFKGAKIIIFCILAFSCSKVFAEWQYLFTISEFDPAYKMPFIGNGRDINHDNYDDLLIGDPYFNNNEGMAKIIFGSADIDSTGDWVVYGPDTYPKYFGRSILNVGDLNGDNESDIVVTEPYYDEDNGCPRYGNLYIYLSSPLDSTADIILGGFEGNSSVAYGDFNGDGYSDLITSRPGGPYSNGTAKLYLGGPDMDTDPDWTFSTQPEQVIILSGAGNDYNGDGYDDFTFWISDTYLLEPRYTNINIYSGDPNLDFEPCVTFRGPVSELPPDNLYRFEWIGDFNSDGFDDFTINREDRYNEDVSFSKVFLGNSLCDTMNSYFLYFYDSCIDSVNIMGNYLGNINNDTYSDVIVTFHKWGTSGVDSAVIIYGSSDSSALQYEFINYQEVTMIKNCGNINGGDNAELAFYCLGDNSILNVFSKDVVSIDEALQPGEIDLNLSVYPNPFNENLNLITYTRAPGILHIYNILGELINEYDCQIGETTITWDGRDSRGEKVSSGIYFVKVSTTGVSINRKLIYLK